MIVMMGTYHTSTEDAASLQAPALTVRSHIEVVVKLKLVLVQVHYQLELSVQLQLLLLFVLLLLLRLPLLPPPLLLLLLPLLLQHIATKAKLSSVDNTVTFECKRSELTCTSVVKHHFDL